MVDILSCVKDKLSCDGQNVASARQAPDFHMFFVLIPNVCGRTECERRSPPADYTAGFSIQINGFAG